MGVLDSFDEDGNFKERISIVSYWTSYDYYTPNYVIASFDEWDSILTLAPERVPAEPKPKKPKKESTLPKQFRTAPAYRGAK
jgi:hypothetical protein